MLVSASRALQQALRRLASQGTAARSTGKAQADRVPADTASQARAGVLAALDPASPPAQQALLSAFVEDVLAEHFGPRLLSDPASTDLVIKTRDALLAELQKNGNVERMCRQIQQALAS